ncbi:hypothetical protein [Saccharothrix lopnurensis]|uniref:Uncharacterized protein n=1 Tax=Saccharothrix lopnurensis TaxID=1670621 RepID=A0ABW1P7K1_9PSEU
MSFWTAVKDAAPVAAAVASAVSAFYASRSASKTSATAKDANQALAMLLRPIFDVQLSPFVSPPNEGKYPVSFVNQAAYPAAAVAFDVRGENDVYLTARTVPEIGGIHIGTTNLRPNNAYVLEVPLPEMVDPGDKQQFTVVVRFSDDRHLQRWEQRFEVRRIFTDDRIHYQQVELHVNATEPKPVASPA